MNELSILCEKVGGDVEFVRKGMTTDVRIGKHFLYPGVGYGGSCFPKDVQALLTTAQKNNVKMGIIDAAEEANARQKRHLVTKVKNHFGDDLRGKRFAIWGLAFKPNTDDMREAPSITIIEELIRLGAQVAAFDPVAHETARKFIPQQTEIKATALDALQGADALLIVTEWNEFRHPDLSKIKQLLKKPIIFDGRNLFDPKKMRAEGFTYFGIGRS